MPTANASLPAPRLDTQPSELVLVVCKFLLNRTHKLPQQWPSREASADFAHLARAAPKIYAPALTTAVRYVNRFCRVKPNPDLLGSWIVINERLLRAHDLVGLEMFHVNLLVAHLPATLRRLWLDAIQISSGDLGALLRQIPAGVRDLAIIDIHIDDETAEILAQSFPLALTHLQLASTQLTNAGLMTVISALPVDRFELLDFRSRQQNTPATLSALAA
ncbi:hypothetical protein GGF31_002455 [Allomyces arbusculus]|nr:hypothetical protein GGF31_002455 [Allomyces arbusculus]